MGKKNKKAKSEKHREPPKQAPLAEAPSRSELRLDLGCGQNVREGYEGVDIAGGKAKHVVDLFKFPWPFQDETVEEINCSHFMEHVPAREIEERDLVRVPLLYSRAREHEVLIDGHRYIDGRLLGHDMLFAFMDECWRILKPEGRIHIVVPSGRSARAFQDPTHRRFFMQETFLYFFAQWRYVNRLDHYRVRCNFHPESLVHSMTNEEGLYADEVKQQRSLTLWNVTVDWHSQLKKLPLPTAEEKAAWEAEIQEQARLATQASR